MTAQAGTYLNLAAAGDKKTGGSFSGAILHTVTINTTGTSTIGSSTLKIYDGQSTTGTLVATIDCSTGAVGDTLVYDVLCKGGVYAIMTGIAADVTVSVL